MADIATVTLGSNLAADGTSSIAKTYTTNIPGFDSTTYKVQIEVSGTMNGATVQVVSSVTDQSPLALVNTKGADGSTVGTFTETGTFLVELISGAYFAVVVSGSGSPVPDITVTARGPIELV